MNKKPPQGLHNQKSPENADSSPAMALIRAQARVRLLQKSDGPPHEVVRFVEAPGALADEADFDWETWRNRKPKPSVWTEADIQRRLDELPMGGPPQLLVFFEKTELNADGTPLNDEGDSKNAPKA